MIRRAVVIGAGLSGLSLSRALVRAGISVVLHERGDRVAMGASGNPAGIFKPILTKNATLQSRLADFALPALRAELARLEAQGFQIAQSRAGIYQLARTAEEAARFAEARVARGISSEVGEWVSADVASQALGHAFPFGGLFWRGGGWVSPRELCGAWLTELSAAPEFDLRLNSEFPLDPSKWAENGKGAEAIFVCAGPASVELPEFRDYRYQLIRGQLSEVRFEGPHGLATPVSFHEYAVPLSDRVLLLGATHDRADLGEDPREADHFRLLERCGEMLPEKIRADGALRSPIYLRAGIRFTSQSRIPLLAPLPETSARAGMPVTAFTALGSRGILWSVVLADALVDRLRGEVSLLDADPRLATSLASISDAD